VTSDTTVRVALMVARISGLFALLLGLAFWTGNGLSLVQAHMGFGILLVLSLWTLAGLGARAGVGASTVIPAVLWGIIVVGLGAIQRDLPPTGGYSLVRVLHLLVGLGALALAETLGGRIKRAR
jgi:hypothetical protein